MRLIRNIILKMMSMKNKFGFDKYSLHGRNLIVGAKARCDNASHKRESITIGNNCDIQGILITKKDGFIRIGDYTTIRYNSLVGSIISVCIGSNVIISNNVTIMDNNNHPTSAKKRYEMTQSGFYSSLWNWENSTGAPITIKDNVWIGEKSTILKGVTIGEGSIVGACSMVTKDVPPFTIVAGNPAKVVKKLDD